MLHYDLALQPDKDDDDKPKISKKKMKKMSRLSVAELKQVRGPISEPQ